MSFSTILVANRGEIACRIIRTARALGYATVAVFSDADADAPHVRLADRAVRIGPPPVRDSYLDPARLLDAARRGGADALHPGYGFLSENDAFAQACQGAGLVFIGPSPAAIRAMGNKAAAKRAMLAAGVPCIPGFQDSSPEGQSDARLLAEARAIGVPLLIKAAAGGGGRGMRLVADLDALPAAIASARSEAAGAFGSGELILERAITRGRHVEIQVFGDAHGRVIHLGERDCSVQRRHQKVVEESPSPALTPELRAAMGAAAVRVARAIDYAGAGTVEFMLDHDGRFYFLEMNTRLQVEHPVTELVTGLDLVAWQLRVAAGEPLPRTQEQVELRGHAIEVRLYAEDPYAGYLPQSGAVVAWEPAEGEGVRVDHGLRAGQTISPFYDPMVAKVIAHGRTRDEARRRLAAALQRCVLLGPPNNKHFLAQVLRHPVFAAGGATTRFLDEHLPAPARPEPDERAWAIAAVLWCLQGHGHEDMSSWRSASGAAAPLTLQSGELRRELRVELGPGGALVRAAAGEARVQVLAREGPRVRVAVDEVQETVHAAFFDDRLYLDVAGAQRTYAEAPPPGAATQEGGGDGKVLAPTSGRIVAVHAAVGDRVRRGQLLITLEAMKIENGLSAAIAGIVAELKVRPGDQVSQGRALALVTPDPT